MNKGVKWSVILIWIFALVLFLCSGFRINKEQLRNPSNWHFHWNNSTLDGNGIFSEKEYFISPVDYIHIENSLIAQLQIEQTTGDSVSILISGDENLIDRISYHIRDNKLYLSTYDNVHFHTNNNLMIYIQTPSLKGVKANAIGNVTINKAFKTESFEIEMDGAGRFQADSLFVQLLKAESEGVGSIQIAGTAHEVNLRLKGAGEINAVNLLSDTVVAHVDGVGSIRCNPIEYLDGVVSGIGKITYKNEPKERKVRTLGIGKIGLE
jgi:hypothetical protein